MVNKLKLLLLVGFSLVFAVPEVSATSLSVAVEKHKETIVLSVKTAHPYKVFTLPRPDRLVIDVPATGQNPQLSLPSNYRGDLLDKVRFGQFDPHTWRVVFDLNQPIRVLSNDEEDGSITVVITASEEEKAEEHAGAPVKTLQDKTVSDKRHDDNDDDEWPEAGKKNIAIEEFNAKTEKKRGIGKSRPVSSARNPAISSDHEHGKPVIVIDPGHGGVDPGTEGPDGTYEKDVVLAYARDLRERLLKTGHYKVLLTRDTDDIIPLRERVSIARKDGASIFISLHADSAPEEDVRGLSIYTVSEKASDVETAALAARENKADVLTGVNLNDERGDVADILISLAQRETKNRSATLADLLVTTLDGRVRLLSNSHRFAGFAVLKAPDVPSVLIEIGFLSHPKEEQLINSKAYRDKVTSGIAAGVDQYFRQEKHMGDQ